MGKKTFVALLMSVGLMACVSTGKLRTRASFDMNCPEDQLSLTELDRNRNHQTATYGVSGCGKRSTYIYTRETGWVANNAQ